MLGAHLQKLSMLIEGDTYLPIVLVDIIALVDFRLSPFG